MVSKEYLLYQYCRLNLTHEVQELLKEKGVDIVHDDGICIRLALQNQNPTTLEALLKYYQETTLQKESEEERKQSLNVIKTILYDALKMQEISSELRDVVDQYITKNNINDYDVYKFPNFIIGYKHIIEQHQQVLKSASETHYLDRVNIALPQSISNIYITYKDLKQLEQSLTQITQEIKPPPVEGKLTAESSKYLILLHSANVCLANLTSFLKDVEEDQPYLTDYYTDIVTTNVIGEGAELHDLPLNPDINLKERDNKDYPIAYRHILERIKIIFDEARNTTYLDKVNQLTKLPPNLSDIKLVHSKLKLLQSNLSQLDCDVQKSIDSITQEGKLTENETRLKSFKCALEGCQLYLNPFIEDIEIQSPDLIDYDSHSTEESFELHLSGGGVAEDL